MGIQVMEYRIVCIKLQATLYLPFSACPVPVVEHHFGRQGAVGLRKPVIESERLPRRLFRLAPALFGGYCPVSWRVARFHAVIICKPAVGTRKTRIILDGLLE